MQNTDRSIPSRGSTGIRTESETAWEDVFLSRKRCQESQNKSYTLDLFSTALPSNSKAARHRLTEVRRKSATPAAFLSSPSKEGSWKQPSTGTHRCFAVTAQPDMAPRPHPAPSQWSATLSSTAGNNSTHPLFLNTIIYCVISGSRKGWALITTTCAGLLRWFPITGFSSRLHFSKKTFAFLTQE